MANDSHLFRTREQLESGDWVLKGNVFRKDGEVCLPLYEGKMVWHFDHRFGTYEGQTQAQSNQGKLPELTEQQHINPSFQPMPQYWIHELHFSKLIYDRRTAFLVFRDITSSVAFRTSIFSILPVVVCADTLHVVVTSPEFTYELAYFSSCGSSFVFDYVTRQKLGGSHLKYFTLKQLPILLPNSFKVGCKWEDQISVGNWILPRVLELSYTAWDLESFASDCGYNGPPFRWNEERRFLLRCELDAAYFHLYGIDRYDVDYIMGTFPIVKRKDEKQYGEYRTKRMILEIYDRMQRAVETGEPYRTRLEPPPADPAVAHEPRVMVNNQK